jgi:hypothetical protein
MDGIAVREAVLARSCSRRLGASLSGCEGGLGPMRHPPTPDSTTTISGSRI